MQLEARATSGKTANPDAPAKGLDACLDDIQPNPSPRDPAHAARSAEPWRKQQRQQGLILQWRSKTALAGGLHNPIPVNSRPVIGNQQYQRVPFFPGIDPDLASRGLAFGQPGGRKLDAMIQRLAYKVNKRLGKPFRKLTLDFEFSAADQQIRLLAKGLARVSSQTMQASKNFIEPYTLYLAAYLGSPCQLSLHDRNLTAHQAFSAGRAFTRQPLKTQQYQSYRFFQLTNPLGWNTKQTVFLCLGLANFVLPL